MFESKGCRKPFPYTSRRSNNNMHGLWWIVLGYGFRRFSSALSRFASTFSLAAEIGQSFINFSNLKLPHWCPVCACRINRFKLILGSFQMFLTCLPIQIKMVEDKPQTNVYCWSCAGGDPNQQCSKCIRHFHQACVENLSVADWICGECTNDDDFKWVLLKQKLNQIATCWSIVRSRADAQTIAELWNGVTTTLPNDQKIYLFFFFIFFLF